MRFEPLALNDRTNLTEVRPRRSRKKPRGVTMPQSADKIGFDLAAGEEFTVDRVVVEARHWPAIEPNRPRRDDKVTALQAAVPEGSRFCKIRLVDEPGACVDVRE